MKRAYCESDFEDEGYMTERFIEGNDDDETTARKRRRGLIEKKRRDRINSCLTELRRLVPTAVDKQGSTKLEKAEILQLTVEHLRNVRNLAKREAAYRDGADYRAAGFRECLSEVARYLQSSKDPSCKDDDKTQLMSHLNTVITPQGYHTRSPTTPSVVWPLTRGVPPQGFYHDDTTPMSFAVAKMKTEQQVPNARLHEKHASKDRQRLNKKPNVLITPGVADVSARQVENHYPFTMYPIAAQRRDEGLMIRFPLLQRRDNMPPKSEQIMFGTNARTIGTDPAMIRNLFCQPF